jgi:hypothetical protein
MKTNGPGKYDPECTALREATQSGSVIAIIVDGIKGSGFSVQSIDPHFVAKLPEMLRGVADEIERDLMEQV